MRVQRSQDVIVVVVRVIRQCEGTFFRADVQGSALASIPIFVAQKPCQVTLAVR
jgi:hypothetical protein